VNGVEAGLCDSCAMRPACYTRGTHRAARTLVERLRTLARGELLFEAGSPALSVFAVRSGTLKVSMSRAGCTPRIVRFVLPGELAGLDAFDDRTHSTTAVALEECEVCEIPAWHLELLCQMRPALAAHLRRQLAREVGDAYLHAAALAGLSASQRVAGFLLGLGQRWSARGGSASRFPLPFERREIGDHLGLTMETVSRVLSLLRARAWIVEGPAGVELCAIEALRGLASGEAKLA
jgi:CRP/FNR family transcriptional regulator, anaerobic regulatory protein